jgi:hypothetical protein
VTASADAVTGFEHENRKAGALQRPRGAKARGAGAYNGNIDFGGEGHAFGSRSGSNEVESDHDLISLLSMISG